jgi:hypothetical protein
VLIVGAGGTLPGAALIVYSCLVTLPHANLREAFGSLGRIFVSPAFDRLHHVAEQLDARGTVNFGFVLARRVAYPSGGAPLATGISGRPIPLEQSVLPAGTPRVVLAQLVQPFRVHAATDGPS